MKRSSVAIIRCHSYDGEEVLKGLRQSIDLIGGIGGFVGRGDRVLLKPNLIYGKNPDKAVTTHPSVLRGTIRIVREAGGIPIIGDSPGIGSLKRAAEKAGIKKVADEMGCDLVEFDRPVFLDGKEGKFFKKLEVDQSILEADVVINLPKWKTHAQMLLTLGVKNLFGCIPGPRKALWHLKAGDDHRLFARMLVDLYRVIRPSLTLLDGVVGMEGNGPGSGDPISLGLILASGDALNLDQVVCDLIGLPRNSLPTNRAAFDEGLGKDPFETVGEPVDGVRVPHFNLPNLTGLSWGLPGFLKRALRSALTSKPTVEEDLCETCNRCEEICPPRALKRRGEKLVFDYGKCIRCFCCLEICPAGAISTQQGWALRLIGKKSKIKG